MITVGCGYGCDAYFCVGSGNTAARPAEEVPSDVFMKNGDAVKKRAGYVI